MRRPLIAILLVLAAAALLLPMQPASTTQGTLAASTLPSWQTNGTVVAIAYAGGVVYLAGDFTSVRPSGAAAGTGEVARTHLAAFSTNASTGFPLLGSWTRPPTRP
jgi:hypothetical protein